MFEFIVLLELGVIIYLLLDIKKLIIKDDV